MSYLVLIALHAAAGAVAFVAGMAALTRHRLLGTYQWTLVASMAFLLLAVAVGAAGRSLVDWAVTGALLALGAVMVARALRASTVRPGGAGASTPAYVHHVGFGLVGLFDAFWVVALLRAGLPGWAVGAVAVAIAVGGHLLLARHAARATRSAAPA